MAKVTIDGTEVEVEGHETILEAAAKIGLKIPTLCYLPESPPVTTCMVCVVKVNGGDHLLPACGTKVHDGMVVESETEAIIDVRRTTVELLFSEHLGDCLAPCTTGCPAGMDIPRMIRQIYEDRDLDAALETVVDHLPIPGILSHVCRAPCENACRRSKADQPIAIAQLVKVTSRHLHQLEPEVLRDLVIRHEPRDQRIAVIGSGPAGLACAFYARRLGLDVTILEKAEKPGGDLRTGDWPNLPAETLERELGLYETLGVEFRCGVEVGKDVSFEQVREEFAAVFVATGDFPKDWGLPAAGKRPKVDAATLAAPGLDGVFLGGTLLRPKGRMAVRSVADGRIAANAISQWLAEEPVKGAPRRFSTHIGKLQEGEIEAFLEGISPDERFVPEAGEVAGYTLEEAVAEGKRCLHCDCRQTGMCSLQDVGEQLGCNYKRFRSERPNFKQLRVHKYVIFEPGKCINCGHCINIAEAAGESIGMTWLNRGYDTTVGVPFDRTLEEGLVKVAREVVAACPVGALAFKSEAADRAEAEERGLPPIVAAPRTGPTY